MNIGTLAELTGVTPDTLRYYEKKGLLDSPSRGANGYRIYSDADAARVRFVRSAQALGFSLAEVLWIIPRLSAGRVNRAEIEQHLMKKLAEIDAHIAQLHGLRKELLATFSSLGCAPDSSMSVEQATAKGAPQRLCPAQKRK